MNIFIANNAAALTALNLDATVEAEYGVHCVNGSILTLAHHGPRKNRPCPCSTPNLPALGIESVGISHVDLDTLGGLMAILGIKPGQYDWVADFWRIAAEIDLNGIHKIPTMNLGVCPEMVLDSLNAFYAFSETEGRVSAPRDGSAAKIELVDHFMILSELLVYSNCSGGIDDHEHAVYCGCPDWDGWGWNSPARLALIEKGKTWAAAKAELERESYVGTGGSSVIVRSSEQFTAHLYWHNFLLHKAIVSFNPKTGSITVSCCDVIPGFHAGEFCQQVWGEGAGGRAGIGGSPRGQKLTLDEAKGVAIMLATIIG